MQESLILTFCIGKSRNKKKKKSKAEEIAELANKEKDHSSDDGDTERSSTSVKKTAAELAFEKAQEKRVR